MNDMYITLPTDSLSLAARYAMIRWYAWINTQTATQPPHLPNYASATANKTPCQGTTTTVHLLPAAVTLSLAAYSTSILHHSRSEIIIEIKSQTTQPSGNGISNIFIRWRDESELCRETGWTIPLLGDGMNTAFVGGRNWWYLRWDTRLEMKVTDTCGRHWSIEDTPTITISI